jgi:PAS domain S-box-containing protein
MNTTDVMALDAAHWPSSRAGDDQRPVSLSSFFRGIRLPLRSVLAGSHAIPALEPNGRRTDGTLPVAALLDLTYDAICIRSMSSVIEYWNHAAEKLYGWKSDEAVGRVSHALFKTVFPAPLDHIEAHLLRTGYWEGELVHTLKDGTRVTINCRWALLRDEASAPIAIFETHNDTTERKRAEAERVKLEARLRQAERMEAIGRLASGVVHDFNNVLAGIYAYGEMLFDEAPENTPRKRYSQNVLAAARRGRELVDQILAFMRSQRNKYGPADVCRTVAETLDLVRSSLPGSIALQPSIPDKPLIVMGDATQLHQIVMNLCSNSIHAMKAGGPLRVAVAPLGVRADRALSHGNLRAGAYVRVSVEDGGCGMDEATLGRIFEPFFTTKEAGHGTGLGLALVHAIVADFGGVIDVKSVPDEGSTFSIYIPLADTTTAARSSA